MTLIFEALSKLFSLAGLLSFLFGVGATLAYYRMTNRTVRVLAVLWSIVFIMSGYLAVGQYKFAASTQKCQELFAETLKTRAKITEENDHWSLVQRQAFRNLLYEALNPPPEITRLISEDPHYTESKQYQQWYRDTMSKHYQVIHEAHVEQQKAIEERRSNPIPDPRCEP